MKITRFLCTASLLVACTVESVNAQTDFDLELLATGLNLPVDIEASPDNKLFILEKGGSIKIVEDGQVLSQNFLSISVNTDSEQGLLGMAFDPDYSNNGHFFIYYSQANAQRSIVSRFTVSADPLIADPNSELVLFTLSQPQSNHNGGDLNFGPDGYLYIGLGDGGRSVDAQDHSNLLGNILRIDVSSSTEDEPYTIPSDNPFVNDASIFDEVWSQGWRNPWRFSFDQMNGDMWIGDVGQDRWEEVSYEPATAGGGLNYGWRCFEATQSYNGTDCGPSTDYVEPVFQYALSNGNCTVIGGYVYRGSEFAGLAGKYIMTDFCSGQFRALSPDGSGGFVSEDLLQVGWRPSSFGQNRDGDLFIADYGGGRIYKIVGGGSSVDSENELPNLSGIELYPNPVVNKLRLSYDDHALAGADISIFDVNGSLVGEGMVDGSGQDALEVGGLPKGAYFLRVAKEGRVVTRLFVKG